LEFKESSVLDIHILKNLSAKEMADIMSVCRYAICPPSTVSYEYLSKRGGELYLNVIADNQKNLYDFYIKNHIAFDISELFIKDVQRIEHSLMKQKQYFDRKQSERIIGALKVQFNCI
jgi:predicted DNA-binding protein YlxM (UPF0122 family)